jgi:hypothetical protein
MARGRVYTVSFNAVAITAVQDLFSLKASSTVPFEIHSITLGQVSLTSVAGLKLHLQRGTITQGSGGSVPTPQPLLPNDAASVVTAHANDTSQASFSGGGVLMMADAWEILNGYLYMPFPDDRPVIPAGGGIALSLDTAPSASMTASGTMTFGELS